MIGIQTFHTVFLQKKTQQGYKQYHIWFLFCSTTDGRRKSNSVLIQYCTSFYDGLFVWVFSCSQIKLRKINWTRFRRSSRMIVCIRFSLGCSTTTAGCAGHCWKPGTMVCFSNVTHTLLKVLVTMYRFTKAILFIT